MTTTTLNLRIGQPEVNQMLEQQTEFHPPAGPSKTRLITEFREFEQNLANANDDLTRVLAPLGVQRDFTPTGTNLDSAIGSAPIEEARQVLQGTADEKRSEVLQRFIDDLEEGVAASRIGEIHWSGLKSCELTFIEKKTSRTWTKKRRHFIRHRHALVDARKHYLPAADVKQPRECRRLVKALELCPWLYKHSYIVTGNHINSGGHDKEEMEVVETPNELVRAARFLGRGIAVTAGGVATVAAALPVAALAVAGDPALIIGQRWAICGWD